LSHLGVDARLGVGRRHAGRVSRHEAFGEGARCIVLVPIPGRGDGQALRRLQAERMNVGQNTAENRFGPLVESRAVAKIIRRGRNVTDAAFLAHSRIKATDALKKDPEQSTRPGSTELLPQLRLLAGRQGVGGWGAAQPAFCDSSRTAPPSDTSYTWVMRRSVAFAATFP
jgi:hypothetical protein